LHLQTGSQQAGERNYQQSHFLHQQRFNIIGNIQGVSQLLKQSDWAQIQDFK